jgi:hypothetical protein
MWYETIKINGNNFLITKNFGDLYYSIVDKNNTTFLENKVVKWFINGYILARTDFNELIKWRGEEDSYNYYVFEIYNNSLESIISFKKNTKDHNTFVDDFVNEHLIITLSNSMEFGVINNQGKEILPFRFTKAEARHRLLLNHPLQNDSKENILENGLTRALYNMRINNFLDISSITNFIEHLIITYKDIHEIIYHLLLKRYSYYIIEEFANSNKNEDIPYHDKHFVMNRFDITYLIYEFEKKLGLDTRLSLNYWDSSNMNYSYSVIDYDFKSYAQDSHNKIIEERKSLLNEIVNKLIIKKFDYDRFKELAKKYDLLFESSSPFLSGRQVFIQEYQTIESGYQKKTGHLARIPALYQGLATFLDSSKFRDYHTVRDAINQDIFYVVHKDAIKLDLLQFTYEDYLKILSEVSHEEIDENKLLQFLILNVENEGFSQKILSKYFQVTLDLLEKFRDYWNWEDLSQNQFLPWSIELIGKYRSYWNWWTLSRNEFLPWSIELIGQFRDHWNWETLSSNRSLDWTTELIDKYEKYWYWGGEGYLEGLSNNLGLPWSVDFIEMYEDKWTWKNLSGNPELPLSDYLIEKYKEKWDWEVLCSNPNLHLSVNQLEKYEKYLYWGNKYYLDGLSGSSLPSSIPMIEKYLNKWDWEVLSTNENIEWTIELIDKYADKLLWGFNGGNCGISSNSKLPWSKDLIDKFRDKWFWGFEMDMGGLSGIKEIPWSIELIEKYLNKWSWKELSENPALPWSIELIDKYEKNWSWGGEEYGSFKGLTGNLGLPWSAELVEKYKDKWDWENLSTNEGLPWSLNLLDQNKDKWNWGNLSRNKGVCWSIDVVEKYNDKLQGKGRSLANQLIYETVISPFVNVEIVDQVMGTCK